MRFTALNTPPLFELLPRDDADDLPPALLRDAADDLAELFALLLLRAFFEDAVLALRFAVLRFAEDFDAPERDVLFFALLRFAVDCEDLLPLVFFEPEAREVFDFEPLRDAADFLPAAPPDLDEPPFFAVEPFFAELDAALFFEDADRDDALFAPDFEPPRDAAARFEVLLFDELRFVDDFRVDARPLPAAVSREINLEKRLFPPPLTRS